MKNIVLVFLLFFCSLLYSQTKLVSWNIENLGKSKSTSEIAFMAQTVQDYDIIAIQVAVLIKQSDTLTYGKLANLKKLEELGLRNNLH